MMKKNRLILLAILIIAIISGYVVVEKILPNKKSGPIIKYVVDKNRQFSLPQGYPKDIVPIIEGGKILASGKRIDQENKAYYSVTISIDHSPAEVASFYQTALKGLQIGGKDDDYFFINGNKNNQHISINISPGEVNGNKTVIVNILITTNK